MLSSSRPESYLWLVGVAVLLCQVSVSLACNEAVCASLVSKCMLLKSCECNMMDKNNCTCCKDCHKCLAKLYTECCSCVGMCLEKNPKENMYKTSTVEELDDPIPGLFNVLTEEADPFLRWTTYNYPAHLDLLYFKPRGHTLDIDLTFNPGEGSPSGHRVRHGQHHIFIDPHSDVQNCTVAYMSQCMSLNKCRTSCQSMGAARYRWFHDGCCECIGSSCLDFGKGEAHCLKCPPKPGDEEEDEDEIYDYDTDDEETESEDFAGENEEVMEEDDVSEIEGGGDEELTDKEETLVHETDYQIDDVHANQGQENNVMTQTSKDEVPDKNKGV